MSELKYYLDWVMTTYRGTHSEEVKVRYDPNINLHYQLVKELAKGLVG